jgi:hypothetical protein
MTEYLTLDSDPQLQLMVEYLCQRQKGQLQHLLSLQTKEMRCMARIHDNTQCTRKWKDPVTQLCGSHLHSLPYGRFTDDQRLPITSDLVDLNQYLMTKVIVIDGLEYLIDDHQLIFEKNELTTIVGQQISENQFEWF